VEAVSQVRSLTADLLCGIPVLAPNIAHSDAQHAEIVEAVLTGDHLRAPIGHGRSTARRRPPWCGPADEMNGRPTERTAPTSTASERKSPAMPEGTSPLSIAKLGQIMESGHVDTVLVVFTDMQGRLQENGVHARYFVD
jgi:hypothetical protein